MKAKVVIPFRDRGTDLRRGANLEVVMAWWYAHGFEPQIVDDGLDGDAQFNRHRAYNRAVSRNPDAEVFVFTEADMLIRPDQISTAVRLATHKPMLVVPFTQYRYLSDSMTEVIRDTYRDLDTAKLAEFFLVSARSRQQGIFALSAQSVMDNGKSIGAVNVVSRETLDITGGFTEATSGNWYDDNITEEGFAFLTGSKTQWVPGPAVHLYHLPGWKGDHLSEADKQATAHNKALLSSMRRSIRRGDKQAVKTLMATRENRSK